MTGDLRRASVGVALYRLLKGDYALLDPPTFLSQHVRSAQVIVAFGRLDRVEELVAAAFQPFQGVLHAAIHR